MSFAISPRLNRYKLNASFNGKTVTHTALESNLEAKQRRVKVQTVWDTEDRLGAGAFGVVWRQRADTGQLRAVKVISKAKLNIREVEALIELQDHPDLFIRFFGWFEDLDRDTFHIAMEFIEHGHLGKYIAENQSKVDIKEITSQILEGLVVLHEQKICHRDLKPQNILIASLSPIWVKITDFGISKCWVGTTLKTRCGTTIYRAPEQLGFLPRKFRLDNSYTNHIDIWALGVIVHEMLTLQIPFLETYTNENSGFTSCQSFGENMVDYNLLCGYCEGRNPFPCSSLRRHGVPEDGIEFVKSLMAVSPKERLSAAAALASKWLIQNNGPPLAGHQQLTEPSATTRIGEGSEICSAPEVEPRPSPTSSQISRPIESGNNQDITSVRVDNLPVAPAAEPLSDTADDTTRDKRSSVRRRRRGRYISPNTCAQFLKMWDPEPKESAIQITEQGPPDLERIQRPSQRPRADQTESGQAHNFTSGRGKSCKTKQAHQRSREETDPATAGSAPINKGNSAPRGTQQQYKSPGTGSRVLVNLADLPPPRLADMSESTNDSILVNFGDRPYEPYESKKTETSGLNHFTPLVSQSRLIPLSGQVERKLKSRSTSIDNTRFRRRKAAQAATGDSESAPEQHRTPSLTSQPDTRPLPELQSNQGVYRPMPGPTAAPYPGRSRTNKVHGSHKEIACRNERPPKVTSSKAGAAAWNITQNVRNDKIQYGELEATQTPFLEPEVSDYSVSRVSLAYNMMHKQGKDALVEDLSRADKHLEIPDRPPCPVYAFDRTKELGKYGEMKSVRRAGAPARPPFAPVPEISTRSDFYRSFDRLQESARTQQANHHQRMDLVRQIMPTTNNGDIESFPDLTVAINMRVLEKPSVSERFRPGMINDCSQMVPSHPRNNAASRRKRSPSPMRLEDVVVGLRKTLGK